MYFLLAGVMDLFRYLHYGLAAVLAFVGVKMVGEYLVTGHHLVSPAVSLVIIAVAAGHVDRGWSSSADRRERCGRGDCVAKPPSEAEPAGD